AKKAIIDCCGEVDFSVDEIQFIPNTYTTLKGDDVALFEKFLAMLDDLDDVQRVYHNVELS
ncbi:MAG: YebC/PmpR family DNA-binding transcriptional regulator, partial [Cycloclasticus sp.]